MRKLNGRKAVADILLVIEKHCERSLSLLDIFYRLLFLSKSSFLKNYFRTTIRESNSFDPDQARHFVRP